MKLDDPQTSTLKAQAGLRVTDLELWMGARRILEGVTFDAPPGEVTVIVGHNGAGKTTLLRAISGVLPSRGGSVHLGDVTLTHLKCANRSRAGVALVPDGASGVFADMTVAENLELSVECARLAKSDRPLEEFSNLATELFPDVVRDRRGQRASSLSGGQRQMLAIAMALTRRPSLLMLDEPSLGLAPRLTEQVLRGVQTIVRTFGISCILVEQNVGIGIEVADSLLVLKEGAVSARFARGEVPALSDLWPLF